MPNFTESMNSERYWKDATTFKPERWLDDDGQLKNEIPKSFIPFGIGLCNSINTTYLLDLTDENKNFNI